MACFTCTKEKTQSQIEILKAYQECFEKTGRIFWFFKIEGSNEIFIISNDDFKQYRKDNKELFDQKKVEFAHIQEFRYT